MKKLFYFSRSRLQFVELKNFKKKLLVYFGLSVVAATGIIFSIYLIINSYSTPSMDIGSLKSENNFLKEELLKVSTEYKNLDKTLDSLINTNKDLRTAADLPPVSKEERLLGTGGSSFEDDLSFLKDDSDIKLDEALSYVDKVTRKFEFEKKNYIEIANKLKENKELFHDLPAIKPCAGTLTSHGFGMRIHPILGVWRMHDGIDIVANIGTPVYAPGDGTVDLVGRRGGYGLAVEIDHGFGYRTVFAHLSRALVKVGQKVKRGDVIAKTGNSGLSVGPHLHYEVHHNGVKLDPANFFFDDLSIFDLNKPY